MREKRGARRICLLAAALLAAALFPAAARAETRTFLNSTDLFPTGGALTEGPANEYPSSIAVSGLSGTVTKVTVKVIGYASASPDDTDMAIVGPNGQAVMLMSDACGLNPITAANDDWTFGDSAPTFLSDNGPCGNNQEASVKPSNYENPDNDALTTGGGPAGPYLNKLSFLAGGSPNGAWNLFVFDDNPGFHGFDTSAWALNLDIQPPPPATPAAPQATAQSAPTLTLKKCKKKGKKRSAGAAKKCKKKKRK
jgi:hypothetical protein